MASVRTFLVYSDLVDHCSAFVARHSGALRFIEKRTTIGLWLNHSWVGKGNSHHPPTFVGAMQWVAGHAVENRGKRTTKA